MAEENKLFKKDQLPEEMMIEIAQRLPPKSIAQFRSLSKPWKSLLSSRDFIKSHLHYQLRRAPERFLVIDKSDNTPHVTIPATSADAGSSRAVPFPRSIRPHQEVQVLGCCNGLALPNLVNSKQGEDCLFVVNPTTKRSTPVLRYKKSEVAQKKFGLGYDESEDDYKVITLMYPVRTNSSVVKTKLQTYSIKTRAKKLMNFPFLHFEWEPIVYADGYLYWLAFRGEFATLIIIAFSLSTMAFHEVPRPAMKLSSFGCEVAVLGGRFALVDRSCPIKICVLEEFGPKLTRWREYKIASSNDGVYNVVCRLGSEEFLLAKDKKKMVTYNCETRVWRDMDIDGLPESFETGMISSFRESLEWPR